MRERRWWRTRRNLSEGFPAMLAVAVLASGCAGTEPYRTLAQAGSSYAEAAEQTLVTYQTTYLDARSEALLNDEEMAPRAPNAAFELSMCAPESGAGRAAPALAPSFATRQCDDVNRVRVVARLIAHAKLLGRYFAELDRLAANDAPVRAGAAATRIAGGLKTVGTTLDRAVPGEIAALPPLARAGVGLMQRAALRSELERNGDTIRRELKVQAKALDWLDRKIVAEQDQLFVLQFRRRVSTPISARRALAAGDRWVEDRRALLLQADQQSGVQAAKRALASLTEAFEALLQGGDADQQLGQLVADVNLMLDVVEPFVGRQ